MTIADNIASVREQIALACARTGRPVESVTLIAVSKTHPAERLAEAAAAGLQHFGENRVEEAVSKIPQAQALMGATATWHMIGHIQSRKAKEVVPVFQVIHSIDTIKVAEKLARQAVESAVVVDAFIEVNISGEATKSGLAAANWATDAEVAAEVRAALLAIADLPGLRVRGLMTMAPLVDDPEMTRPVFANLAALAGWLRAETGYPLPDLSMGMSDDYPIAIEEGATLVRVGRAIFGSRA